MRRRDDQPKVSPSGPVRVRGTRGARKRASAGLVSWLVLLGLTVVAAPVARGARPAPRNVRPAHSRTSLQPGVSLTVTAPAAVEDDIEASDCGPARETRETVAVDEQPAVEVRSYTRHATGLVPSARIPLLLTAPTHGPPLV